MNKVQLIGKIVSDLELRKTPGNISVTTIKVKTVEYFKDKTTGAKKETTEIHKVVLWRGVADYVCDRLKKGDLIYVEGKNQTRFYIDSKGNSTKSFEVIGNKVTLLNSYIKSNTPQYTE